MDEDGLAGPRAHRVATDSVMFIRHAEKPDGGHKGVSPNGDHDDHSLSVRGWTRAGALAALFARPTTDSGITTPGRIIATAPSDSYKSKREHDTAAPTANRLGIKIEAVALPQSYSSLVGDIESSDTSTLVVWHHGHLPEFVLAFPVANAGQVPRVWPQDRFDLIWLLSPHDDKYVWTPVPQGLLAGDTAG